MSKMQPFWWFKAPVITCPEGEQIENGGFETGDFTGWLNYEYAIQSNGAHGGSYYLRAYPAGDVEQELAVPIPTSCIESFTFWVYLEGSGGEAEFTVVVTYTDDTYSIHSDIENTKDTWVQKTVTGLTAGKTVKKIHVYGQWSANPHRIDDISLVGTG